MNFREIITIFIDDIKINELLNTSVDAREFINTKFIKRNKIFLMKIKKFIRLKLIDNKIILNVIYIIKINIKLNDHKNEI